MNGTAHPLHHQLPRLFAWGRVAAGLLTLLILIPEVQAVLTTSAPINTPRQITLQVGGSTGIDRVTFDVNNATVTSLGEVTANGGSILVSLTANVRSPFTNVRLSVDSSTALACVSGSGCGATLIPFTTINWVSGNHDLVDPTIDIQDGTFSGAANQLLFSYQSNPASINMSNNLTFKYANTTVYPAGRYEGRVTFTASIP